MAIETFFTLEKSVAVFTKLPLDEGTVLCIAELAKIPAGMIGDFIESLLAFMAVLFTSKEGWHANDDVVMIIVVVKVKVFLSFRTQVNESIQVFLGYNVELISREDSLKFLDLWNTAWTKGDTRQFMEFLSKASLHPSAMINNALVLRVFVVLCLGYNNRPSTTEFIFVFNLNYASFFRRVAFEVHNITAFSSTTLGI